MPSRSRVTTLLAGAAGAALTFALAGDACSQEGWWSLQPRVVPFPCSWVKLDGNSMVFLKRMVFVCNGNPIEEMPAGSYLGINIVCSGSGAIEYHGFDAPGGLFDVARRTCSRGDRRMPRKRQ
jgi:hypothetical protein